MKARFLNIKTLIMVLLLVFYLWFAFQIPYAHDDWAWGSDLGIEFFVNGSENGRYAGNLFEICMTRSQTLKTLIMGGCMWLIPLLITQFGTSAAGNGNDEKKLAIYLISNILLLLMNRTVFCQTYAWVAGFSNFVLSSAFFMVWISEINILFSRNIEKQKTKVIHCVFSFAMGLVCQLFIENIAIICVVLAIFMCVLYYIRMRRIPGRMICLAIGALLGIMISFASPVYDDLWSTGTAVNGYRNLSYFGKGGLIAQIKSVCWHFALLISRTYGENIVVSLFILALMSVLVLRSNKTNKKLKLLFVLLNAAVAVAFVYFFPHNRYQDNFPPEFIPYVFAVSMVYLFSILGQIIFLFGMKEENRWQTMKLILIWLLIPAVVAPLALTTEVGARLFYTCNMLSVLFAANVLWYALDTVQKPWEKIINCVCVLALTAVCVFHGVIYEEIGRSARERDMLIAAGKENPDETLILPAFPHTDYLWSSAPSDVVWWGYFRDFYQIPDEMEIIIE